MNEQVAETRAGDLPTVRRRAQGLPEECSERVAVCLLTLCAGERVDATRRERRENGKSLAAELANSTSTDSEELKGSSEECSKSAVREGLPIGAATPSGHSPQSLAIQTGAPGTIGGYVDGALFANRRKEMIMGNTTTT